MAHLRAISRVIYLRLSYENVAARLGDLTARGVTFAPGQTLRDLWGARSMSAMRTAPWIAMA